MKNDNPPRVRPYPTPLTHVSEYSRRVGANTAFHVQIRLGFDLAALDDAMSSHGWGGAHWHAAPGQAHLVDPDPISALQDLLIGRRNLVPDEDDALAQALRLPLEHLTRRAHELVVTRPGLLDRLRHRWIRALTRTPR